MYNYSNWIPHQQNTEVCRLRINMSRLQSTLHRKTRPLFRKGKGTLATSDSFEVYNHMYQNYNGTCRNLTLEIMLKRHPRCDVTVRGRYYLYYCLQPTDSVHSWNYLKADNWSEMAFFGGEKYLIENVYTQRYLFQDGPKIEGDRGD